MLTEAQLKRIMKEHFDAEAARDVDWICDTVTEDCVYNVIGPWYPDDPVKRGPSAQGREAVRQLWINYFNTFSDYSIVCPEEEMVAFPEQRMVMARVKITATPNEDFEGFPAGKAFCYNTCALCGFDENGKMTYETVYGSLGQVLYDFRRMREFLAEESAAQKA